VDTTKLQLGDQVECNVRGVPFVATISGKRDCASGYIPITPKHPQRATHRFVKPRQIVKKLESGVEE